MSYFAGMSNIKNIIFDMGGIFLTIDYMLTERAFIELGVTNFGELYSQNHSTKLFNDFEKGKISPAIFFDALRVITGMGLPDDQIECAWNAMLGHFPIERLQWLDGIRKRYKVFLFSNTNELHYNAVMHTYRLETGHDLLDEHFDKAYYSHIMGMRKPDRESYQKILDEQHLDVTETLFIDDTYKNIVGAESVGLQTIFLPPPKTVFDLAI
jgi:putative hydrolase of the HAD superfamily